MPDAGPAANDLPADSGTVELSLLLVTYNSSGVLDGLIQSLQNHPPACRWELIVADNASTDDSVSQIESSIGNASIERQKTNRGFASGVNAAGAVARGDYLALINPDIAWDVDPFAPLLQHFHANRRIGAVAPRLVFPDGRPQLSIRRFPTHRNTLGKTACRHLAGAGIHTRVPSRGGTNRCRGGGLPCRAQGGVRQCGGDGLRIFFVCRRHRLLSALERCRMGGLVRPTRTGASRVERRVTARRLARTSPP